MSEEDRESADQSPENASPYEAPVVEELETSDGPAVTAAGKSKPS